MESVAVANTQGGSATKAAPVTSANPVEIKTSDSPAANFSQSMQQAKSTPQAKPDGVAPNSESRTLDHDALVEESISTLNLPMIELGLPLDPIAILSMAMELGSVAVNSGATLPAAQLKGTADLKSLFSQSSATESSKPSVLMPLLSGDQQSSSDSLGEQDFSDARGFLAKQYLLSGPVSGGNNSSVDRVDILSMLKATSSGSEYQDTSSGTRSFEVSPLFSAHDSARGVGDSALRPRGGLLMSTPVGQNGWSEELHSKIQWISKQDVQTASLRLNPANLGPIEVRVSITQDQATVSFVSSHSSVRDAIELAAPRLRELLSESGFSSVEVNVSAHSQTGGQSRFSEQSEPISPEYATPEISQPENPENVLPTQHWNNHHIDFFA